jgi:hypothetical protein
VTTENKEILKNNEPPEILRHMLLLGRLAPAKTFSLDHTPMVPDVPELIKMERHRASLRPEFNFFGEHSDGTKYFERDNTKIDEWLLIGTKAAWNRIVEAAEEGGYGEIIDYVLCSFPKEDFAEIDWLRFFDQETKRLQTIRSVVESLQVFDSRKKRHGDITSVRLNSKNEIVEERFIVPVKIDLQISFTKTRRLDPYGDPVFKALCDIDLDRLRICSICDHVFWAYRQDAQTCSVKCANTRRQRKYRAKVKGE